MARPQLSGGLFFLFSNKKIIRTMTSEKSINICGKDVKMRYCAATETGYEQLSGKSVATFIPTFGKNEQGEDIIVKPAEATTHDYLMLAVSAIVAAYSRKGEEPPVSTEDILYEATAEETKTLLETIVELRSDWYGVPKVVLDADKAQKSKTDGEEEEQPKN
jgi:hypothetical protein